MGGRKITDSFFNTFYMLVRAPLTFVREHLSRHGERFAINRCFGFSQVFVAVVLRNHFQLIRACRKHRYQGNQVRRLVGYDGDGFGLRAEVLSINERSL